MRSVSHEMTAEQLLGYDVPGKRFELQRGQLVLREPAGLQHGAIGVQLSHRLLNHLERGRDGGIVPAMRGVVFGPDSGFVLARGPDTVRAPDVAFVLADRLPSPMPVSFGELAPDLVVEVRSPGDRVGALVEKVGEYLTAGTQLVWVIDPASDRATVYRADGSVAVIDIDGTLSGESLLPGFALPLRALLSPQR